MCASPALHDDVRVPIRAIGLGSRRLIGLSIQQIGLGPEAVLLIDEIEHGLEPHRQRRLLKKLVTDHASTKGKDNDDVPAQGQVMITTHSPTPIMALPVTALRFVRSTDGVTTVQQVGGEVVDSVQGIIRRISHSVLANKIIICEGTTEEALCRSLDQHWSMTHDAESFAYHSVVAVSGGGRDSGPKAAVELRRLGYDVCFFGETDEPLSISESDLHKAGVLPVLWPDNMATEQRISTDLPFAALQELIDVAIEIHGNQSILDSIGQKLGKPLVAIGSKISDWFDSSIEEASVRAAIGLAAKKTLNGWFKDVNAGESLGNVVTSALGQMSDSPFAKKLAIIEKWVYGK